MQISLFADYGLRTLVRLAATPERLLTTYDIATEFRISRHHLQKVVQALANGRLVETVRGVGGGIRLAMPATHISLAQAIRVLEGDCDIVRCHGKDGDCLLLGQCRMKAYLEVGQAAFFKALESVTLEKCVR